MKLTQREESGLCPLVCVYEELILSRALDMKNTNYIFTNVLYRGEHYVYLMRCLL
jgi:hypothetical protein